MVTRTLSKTVVFARPFILDGMDRVQQAGTYTVETEEEALDTLSVEAWHRVRTVIRIEYPGRTEFLPIDPEQLGKALDRDGAQQNPDQPHSSSGRKARPDRAMGFAPGK